ncbi:4Fe-4S dicluster domain-containing protein [Acidianus sulfidivorans JP7]|uniref:4Fe-4S ferredoxin n=1 Tax=Acidianus sulfidivorans JP7 TaxID=619593 RepID=A0A2U9ILC6_9CREN|nr:4Fe-4S dicluster domain-containing protein [Acidianus sulfidivorans]AWR96810.1 4Fe-4S dicluster domain-containing protein [Acidianus sulfidivorans JP7]
MSSFLNSPLIKYRVSVLQLSELKKENIKTKALIILGDADREKVAEDLGLNPLLIRVIAKESSNDEIEYNKVILENAWTADLAPIEEISSIDRRSLLHGEVKKSRKVDKPVYLSEYCNGLYRACNVCELSCPYNAIKVDKKSGISIDYGKCVACGLCVASCPVSAIQFPSVSQNSIFELAKLKGDKKITCFKNTKSNGIKIPCLAMLSEVDIALLRSNGNLTFECTGCELQNNLKNFIEVIKEYNEKIGGISFYSPSLKIEAKEAKKLGTTPQSFYNRAEARRNITDDLPYILFNVSINNSKCTICESCVNWCPTSALKLKRDTGLEEIDFDPKKCIGCNICVNVCPESCKIQSSKEVKETASKDNIDLPYVIKVEKSKDSNKEVKKIMSDELVRCRVCGVPVGSRKSLEHVKKIMQENGASCEDEWLERCPKHRAEYAFQRRFSFKAKFKPRGDLQ